MAGIKLPLIKANLLRNLTLTFLRECGNDDVFLPYFVFTSNDAITPEATIAFANQIARSYIALHSAFTGPNQRITRQQTATQAFLRLTPPVTTRGDNALLLVTVPPHPSDTLLRFPVQALVAFFNQLTENHFDSFHSNHALKLALAHSFLCTVDYNDTSLNNFPPLPVVDIPEMAEIRTPIITLTPSLPQFSGKPEDDVDLFLTRLDRVLAVYPDATAAQRLFYLENQCTGSALDTIHDALQYLADNPLNPQRTDDQVYDHVKTELKNSYKIDRDQNSYRDQLQFRVKRESESLPEYVQSVLRLCRRAGITNDNEKLTNLHKGLPMHLASVLRPSDYKDVKAFLDTVTSLDKVLGATMRAHTANAIHEKSPLPAPYPSSLFPPAPLATSGSSSATPDQTKPDSVDRIEAVLNKLHLALAPPAATYVHYDAAPRRPAAPRDQNYDRRPQRGNPPNGQYSSQQRFSNRPPFERRPYVPEFPFSNNRFSYNNRQFSNQYRNNEAYNNNNNYNNFGPRRPVEGRSQPDSSFNRNDRSQGPSTRYQPPGQPWPSRRPGHRTAAQNPSYRTPGKLSDFGIPSIEEKSSNMPSRDRPPTPRPARPNLRCNHCAGYHLDSECPIVRSMQANQKN